MVWHGFGLLWARMRLTPVCEVGSAAFEGVGGRFRA